METGGAHSSRVESVPRVPAATRPAVILSGRPTAEWTSNTRARWVVGLLLIDVRIHNNGRICGTIREDAHARHYDLRLNQWQNSASASIIGDSQPAHAARAASPKTWRDPRAGHSISWRDATSAGVDGSTAADSELVSSDWMLTLRSNRSFTGCPRFCLQPR